MSAHDAESLLATLNAAEFYIRTQSALYLGFPSILKVEDESVSLMSGLLDAVGVSELLAPRPAPSHAAPAAIAPAAIAPATTAPAAIAPATTAPAAAPRPTPAPTPTPVPEPMRPVAMPAHVEPDDEEVGDPPTFGEPEVTEDLLRDDASGRGRPAAVSAAVDDEREDTDPNAEPATEIDDDDLEIEVDDPGQDALVTIEDTSDPRSDLEGLSGFADSDLDDDDDSVDDEIIVRKDDGLESFDLMPEGSDSDLGMEEEETFVADLADIERMKARMEAPQEDVSDGPSEAEVLIERERPARPQPVIARAPTPRPATPRAATPPPVMARAADPSVPPRGAAVPVAGVAVPGARAGVTAGLYGNPAVPTIRDRNEPKPRAAAIQIDAAQEQASRGGGGGGALLEEEELLELGSSEDYGEEEIEGGDGLSLDVQEYEEELEEVELDDDDIELEEIAEEEDVPLTPIDDGPSAEELSQMLNRAAAAVEQGDMESGIDFYSDVLDSDPDNIDARVKRGRLYLDYGDYSRAMSDFMVAEELAPTNPEPQIAVGDLYFARKDYSRAIDYFNEALKMSPNHAMAFCRRGISHYYRKHYPQALEDLARAEKLDGDIPNIRTYITMAKKKVRK